MWIGDGLGNPEKFITSVNIQQDDSNFNKIQTNGDVLVQ